MTMALLSAAPPAEASQSPGHSPHRPSFSVFCPPSSRGLALRLAMSIFFYAAFRPRRRLHERMAKK
jgi:hypothetical protein